MTNSRRKGAAGEREVATELFRELGMGFKRDIEQYRTAERGDLICEDEGFPFCVEVKRYAKGWTCKPEWIAQAFKAAANTGQHPCVIYRYDGQQWRCRIWVDAVAEALGTSIVAARHFDTDIQGFAWVAREIMAQRAARSSMGREQ